MYLIPVLLAVDASNATSARLAAEREHQHHALHIGAPRRLSDPAVALADFDVRVYANRIELPPAAD